GGASSLDRSSFAPGLTSPPDTLIAGPDANAAPGTGQLSWCLEPCNRTHESFEPLRTSHGQREVQSLQAPLQCGHDRPRGPWQDDADGGADESLSRQGLGPLRLVSRCRQGVGGARYA